jgi:hypothetical protein
MLCRLFSLTAALAILFASANSVSASDHYSNASASYGAQPVPCWKTIVVYENVTTYETRQVPYVRDVVHYDECGRPYTVQQTCYRNVQVPVTRSVAVTKRVPCGY